MGAFPRGATPEIERSVHDLSGNVREWTRSLSKHYPYDPKDGREDLKAQGARVVRGGSFNNNERNVRAANRNNDDPDNRNNNIGFRLVVSRSSSPGWSAGSKGLAGRGEERRSLFLAAFGADAGPGAYQRPRAQT